MTLGGFLVLLLIAALCGAIGQAIAGYSRGGCLFTVVIGFLGAWAGLLIAGLFGLPEFLPVTIQGKQFPIIWSIIGAALLALVTSVIFSTRRG
jgi:uncharacterized membrane protein YeaQ/YmgE (transglycosylase-associated protein family)